MTHKSHTPLFHVVAIIGLLVTIFGLSQSLVRLISRKSMLKTKQAELVQLQKEKESLTNKLGLAQTPEFIEKEAREKLNLGKVGETIILVEAKTQQNQTGIIEMVAEPNWKRWWSLFF
jgi:cell division protein FtsB